MINSCEQPVDPDLFRAHAANLDALRSLLGDVRLDGQQLGQDQAAFGSLCGWILTCLGDRYIRHDEGLAYLEESLLLMAQGLRRVAEGTQELKELIRHDDDVATRDGTPVIDGPVRSLRGLMDSVIANVRDREWVEPQLSDAGPVAEFIAPVDQIHTALRTAGLHCAMTRVDPLRQLLDDLTGAPEKIASRVGLWHTIATDLHELSDLLRECLEHDLPRRDRQDIRSYLAFMTNNVEGLIGRAEIATAIAVIMKATGDLILLTRDIIRGIIGDLFANAIVWMLDTPVVVSRPVMAERLGVIVATAWRVHAYITALTTSITTLSQSIDG